MGIPLNNQPVVCLQAKVSGQVVKHTAPATTIKQAYLHCPDNYIDALSATKNWAVERQRNAI